MIRRLARPSRHADSGFTLIELLVVIIILGILSAVVVFAVKGTDEKGAKAAKDSDARTLRTAQEAFCAQYGKYATSEAELVNPSLAGAPPGTKGFLSEESTMHDIEPAGSDEPRPCGGTGYKIIDLSDGPQITCGLSGGWCVTEPPLDFEPWIFRPKLLVQLPSGKVLATTTRAVLYDPTTEEWTDGPQINTSAGVWHHPSNMQLLEDDPATADSECASTTVDNCGKVLVLFGGPLKPSAPPGEWFLYDPDDGPLGSWSRIEAAHQPHYGFRTTIVQIMGADCGSHCGKVLIVGQAENVGLPQPPLAELYDPKTNTFELIGSHAPASGSNMAMAPLHDGRVLLVDSAVSLAKLYDPTSGLFLEATPPGFLHPGSQNPLTVLPDGTVLAIGLAIADYKTTAAGIYHPDPGGGAGVWTNVDSCTETASGYNYDPGCYVLASLADGSVLASRIEAGGRQGYGPSTGVFRFDPGTKTWSPVGSTNDAYTPSYGVLLNRGACAPNCKKVLAVGQYWLPPTYQQLVRVAELFTP